MRKNAIHASRGDRIFDTVNIILLLAVFLVVAYPLYFVVCASISDPNAVASGEVIFGPVDVTLEGYEKILDYDQIWIGYRNTIFYAVSGMVLSLLLTIALAYPLSRKDFKLRGPIMVMITITMFFSGGMIPTYLLYSNLHMLDTYAVLILPGAVGVFNIVLMRNFMESISPSLEESAKIDGASNARVLFQIYVPLSKAAIATISMFFAVGRWNAYFNAVMYTTSREMMPVQLYLRNLLLALDMLLESDPQQLEYIATEGVRTATIITAIVPILLVYPFAQKYFVSGMMIGAIKE